ncbi:hypothetical protein CYMTET_27903, partial [Cymbomonas tetramitiformis]
FMLLRYNAKPPMYSMALANVVLYWLPIAVVAHLLIGIWMIAYEGLASEVLDEAYDPSGNDQTNVFLRVNRVNSLPLVMMIAIGCLFLGGQYVVLEIRKFMNPVSAVDPKIITLSQAKAADTIVGDSTYQRKNARAASKAFRMYMADAENLKNIAPEDGEEDDDDENPGGGGPVSAKTEPVDDDGWLRHASPSLPRRPTRVEHTESDAGNGKKASLLMTASTQDESKALDDLKSIATGDEEQLAKAYVV